jgi:putative glutamine amidotransferase
MILGIADNQKKDLLNYTGWVERTVSELQWIKLSHERCNVDELNRCDGLILTGGGDVHPRFYGRPDEVYLARSVSEERDQFEFALVHRALAARLPVLGICRGMQVVNVALHGSLVTDLQAAGFSDHGKVGPGIDRHHDVGVAPGTLLHEIVSVGSGEVNSSHHQAVDAPGEGLRITATSPDGVSEAAEWENQEPRSFLLLVQWHPERMKDANNAFSHGVLKRFIDAVHRSIAHQAAMK